jgi:hypothetical protein
VVVVPKVCKEIALKKLPFHHWQKQRYHRRCDVTIAPALVRSATILFGEIWLQAVWVSPSHHLQPKKIAINTVKKRKL